MRIRYFVLIFVVSLFCVALLVATPVFGNGGEAERSQTWPSRTPTSAGPGPTQNPPATATIPGQTPAPTIEPSPTPGAGEETPESGSSPGAGVATVPPAGLVPAESPGSEATQSVETNPVKLPSAGDVGDCGFPPMVQALGPVSVRSGPGTEYEVVANLVYQDQRPVIGRAATAPWWLIQLSAQQQAWVSDLAVSVAGYTGAVPAIASSDSKDQRLWEPTPNPLCTPPAQETITASAAIVVAAFTSPNRTSATKSPDEPSLEAETESDATGVRSPGFSLLEPEDASSGTTLLWLPAVGIFLILAGGIAAIVQRRRS